MRLANLTTEHPTLAATAAELLAHVDRWSDEVLPAQSASAWVHHGEFARRAEQLAGHLEATLALAEEGRFPSGFAVARTALEHHLLDRLLLLADRYEEIVRPPDPELVEDWEQAEDRAVDAGCRVGRAGQERESAQARATRAQGA